ncbi:hypothetical protein [Mesorhizobium sp. KR9-304]|uniref:hypothetical protein n=1 Tax=Mesorhizobium sp. KR9-304 TaxID=3156614 RepID=UPI0032B4B748
MAQAAHDAMDAYREQRVVDEPHITDRFLGSAETRLDIQCKGWEGRHIHWRALTLRAGSRSAAHEKEHGADLLGVFTAKLKGYHVAKGFLAQAKKAEPGVPFSSAEWKRLQGQCRTMLARTPDAFVVTYSTGDGMRFFSALGVASYEGKDIFRLYGMAPRQFFERHFQSFIGDQRLHTPTIDALRALLRKRRPEADRPAFVLHMQVREG